MLSVKSAFSRSTDFIWGCLTAISDILNHISECQFFCLFYALNHLYLLFVDVPSLYLLYSSRYEMILFCKIAVFCKSFLTNFSRLTMSLRTFCFLLAILESIRHAFTEAEFTFDILMSCLLSWLEISVVLRVYQKTGLNQMNFRFHKCMLTIDTLLLETFKNTILFLFWTIIYQYQQWFPLLWPKCIIQFGLFSRIGFGFEWEHFILAICLVSCLVCVIRCCQCFAWFYTFGLWVNEQWYNSGMNATINAGTNFKSIS